MLNNTNENGQSRITFIEQLTLNCGCKNVFWRSEGFPDKYTNFYYKQPPYKQLTLEASKTLSNL